MGINDSTHATETWNMELNEDNVLVGAQDFQGQFKLLDNTLAKVFPKADIRMAPVIATKERRWLTDRLMQSAFETINKLIKERKHVEYDSYLPSQMNWICNDRVHFKDFDGVKFWKMIFEQLNA